MQQRECLAACNELNKPVLVKRDARLAKETGFQTRGNGAQHGAAVTIPAKMNFGNFFYVEFEIWKRNL
jgi:hypothetical protein